MRMLTRLAGATKADQQTLLVAIQFGMVAMIVLAVMVLFQSLEQSSARNASAMRLVENRGARLERILERSRHLPSAVLATAGSQHSSRQTGAALRDLLSINGVAASLQIEPYGGERINIAADGPISHAVVSGIEDSTARAIGPPLLMLDRDQILVTQAALTGEGRDQRFWGYISTRIPMQNIVGELGLHAITADEFRVNLILTPGTSAAPLAIFGSLEPTKAALSHLLPLPQGGSLRLAIAPDPRNPASTSVLLAGLTAVVALLLWACVRRTRHLAPAGRSATPIPVDTPQEVDRNARVLAESHFERSHAMLESMLEHFPGIVVIKRADDLRIMRVSESAEELLGRDRDSLLGRSSEELYSPEFALRMNETDRMALAQTELVELPLEKLTMTGQSPRWVSYRKLALRDGGGKAHYVLEFGEDLTERERLYHAMQEQVHFVEQLLDAIPGPLFYKDADGKYLGVNTAFESFYGMSRTQLVGRTVFDIAPADLAEIYDKADNALLAEGGTQVYESQVKRANGTTAEVSFHKAVYRSTSGKKGGIVGVALDITERKEAERRVRRLNRILAVLGECNQVILQVHDRHELLSRIGELLRERGRFPVAWFATIGDEGDMVFADSSVAPTVDRLLSRLAAPASGDCAVALRRCRLIGSGLSGAEELTALGLEAAIHLPLEFKGVIHGCIGLMGTEKELFAEDIERQLADLAGNLARALDAIAQEEARRAAEKKLQLARQIFENNAEGIIVTDAANRIVMVNKAFTQLTGYGADEVLGCNPSLLASGRQDDQFYQTMWTSLQAKGEWRGEIINRRKNGEFYPEFLTISIVRDDCGTVTHYVAVFADLTARKQVEEKLEFLAHYDPLTALPNRILFTDRLGRSLSQAARKGQRVALYFLDLDRFSLINDTFGPAGGDRLLQEVSRRLQTAVNDNGSVSRMGGDEFAIFAEALATPAEAAAFAHRIQDAMKAPLRWNEQEIHVSASIGVGVYPDDGEDVETLVKNADSAMYQAIGDGGNTVRFFHQDMNEHSIQRLQLEGKLHHALDRGEFSVCFQPFIEPTTGRLIGAEALLRWTHPDVGSYSNPAAFIPLLEETGLITSVGEWVIVRAIEEATAWRDLADKDMVVAVNLSAVQLADDNFPQRLEKIIRAHGLQPHNLEIELTESTVMKDPVRGIRLLGELRALGVQISVDDFGTGYSSLSYLKRLPITTLKIDRSFVMDIPEDDQALTIAQAIIAMGHSLGLQIIAEGIESPAQANILRDAGVDIAQGYFYGHPMSARDFRQFVITRSYAEESPRGRQLARA